MRRRYVVAASAVAAVGLAGPSLAAASTVIAFTSVQVSEKSLSKSRFVITDNDLVGGKKVGTDTLDCSLAGNTNAQCTIVIRRAEGTIDGAMSLVFAKSAGTGRVTGGTRAYAGATGTFTFENLNQDGTRTRVVVTLS